MPKKWIILGICITVLILTLLILQMSENSEILDELQPDSTDVSVHSTLTKDEAARLGISEEAYVCYLNNLAARRSGLYE